MPRWIVVLGTWVILAGKAACAEESALFPFVLPWDDTSPGVTNVSSWLPHPAGKDGPVHAGKDGHLYTGERRIRFFGVNVAFEANFPRKQDAGKVAGRMARFGINVVRFHHMDAAVFPEGIRARSKSDTGSLDPEALARLDYFLARLAEHGIYANLNLLVSRPFGKGDGLPEAIERVDTKDRHVIGFFYPPLLELQKDYARRLLTHRNPHTDRTYAEDPAVAFVEINNENGLLHAWLAGHVDNLPDVFLRELQRQWNAWLVKRHGTSERLRQAWRVKEEAPGEEMLANADLRKGTDRWVLERHEGAKASLTVSDDRPPKAPASVNRSLRVEVTRPSTMSWHLQVSQPGLKVRANRPYTLSFWARADRPLTLGALVAQAHEPWKDLGLSTEVKLDTTWKQVRLAFSPSKSDDNARLLFGNLARQKAAVWLAGASLRPGGIIGLGAGERLEEGTIRPARHSHFAEWTARGQYDWLRFLWETEDAYWRAMYRYLKEELKVRGVVIGTIVGCSTPNLMARLDATDAHAYWQHPDFPRKPWDAEDWVVPNRSIVNEKGGPLAGLALRRVEGKPHCVTEYNHPAPNTFGSEAFLLLAAYGAFQDWDAIYAFAYSHRSDWDLRRIPGFFDIDQHPTRMATLSAAVAMFVRGDVRAAREEVVAGFSRDQEINPLRHGAPWQLVHAGTQGVRPEAALVHRVAVATGEHPFEGRPGIAARPLGPRYNADTGELVWDTSQKGRGVVTVNTPRSKTVIGYVGGKHYDLGNVVIEPGATRQDGWCALTVTAMEGSMASGPARLLITATGHAENTGMKWKSPARDSVGRNWGRAPSLVEGIPARLTLPVSASRVRAWSLDERGQRKDALRVQEVGEGKAALSIGPGQKTLWYEVEIK
jgi:hypothetical protein